MKFDLEYIQTLPQDTKKKKNQCGRTFSVREKKTVAHDNKYACGALKAHAATNAQYIVN